MLGLPAVRDKGSLRPAMPRKDRGRWRALVLARRFRHLSKRSGSTPSRIPGHIRRRCQAPFALP